MAKNLPEPSPLSIVYKVEIVKNFMKITATYPVLSYPDQFYVVIYNLRQHTVCAPL